MLAVTRYQANDGSIWREAEKAAQRDELLEQLKRLDNILPKGDFADTCNFSNGSGYIQHGIRSVREAHLFLVDLTRPHLEYSMQKVEQEKEKFDWSTAGPQWFCRMLDGGCAPLERAWSRLCNIDYLMREWGQMYYALHPEKGDQECLLNNAGVQPE